MLKINKHKRCRGICLFKFRNIFIEIWFCPRNYEIEKHYHENICSHIIFLFGHAIFFKNERSLEVGWFKNIFRVFTISNKDIHWFKSFNVPLIFVNISISMNNKTAMSASTDFNYAS